LDHRQDQRVLSRSKRALISRGRPFEHVRAASAREFAQFRRGYAHTSVYLLRDRADEDGNQSFGFYQADYSPRKAAIYLHNLTTILAD
jgi:hypothetical protein